jgi:hypothetical protein
VTTPSTTPYVYDGPFDAVAVVLPSGRTAHVNRGETLDALPSEVAALDAAEGFKPAKAEAPAKAEPAKEQTK